VAAIERDTMPFDKVVGELDVLERAIDLQGDRVQARPEMRAVLSSFVDVCTKSITSAVTTS
jgi:hypothetical protein